MLAHQFDLLEKPINTTTKRKIKWLLILRFIIATILLGSITIVEIKSGQSTLTPFYILIAFTYLLTILYSVLFHYLNNLVVFAYIQLIGDILIETCLIYFTGGIESTLSFTFIVSIITASIILSRKGSLIIASLSSILYGLLLDLQYYGILSLPSSYIPRSTFLTSGYVFHTIFVNICAYFLTALLSGYLAESRKKINQALVAKEEDLIELKTFNEEIMKNMHSGLIVTNMEGKITLANNTALELLGIEETFYNDQKWQDIFPTLDFKNVVQSLAKYQRHILKYTELINCESKGDRFLGINLSFLKNGKGQKKGLICYFQDLTEFKKMEEQIKQTEILATIGGMAAGIAHELRNPLTAIRGSIQLLTDGLTLDREQERLIEIILRESTHLNTIINDFLIYAKPANPNCELCDINTLINDIITMLHHAEDFNHDIKIVTKLEKQNSYLTLDMNQIRQVLWNLAINACQAMPAGGILTIRSATNNYRNKPWKIIEVQDTGLGIPKEQMLKLFHPFHTTKEKGTGLGLCTAYRILESHGGTIEAESSPGKGSLFKIFLPLKTPSDASTMSKSGD